MKDIAIYGGGGLGREIALMIRQINALSGEWNILGFYDDALSPNAKLDGLSVLGGMDELNRTTHPLNLAVSISDPDVRQRIVKKISNPQIQFPTLVHPACLPGENNQIGRGCMLTAGVILTTGIRLAEFVLVNLATTIGHDVQVGSYTSIMPGVNISGNVRIGSGSLIGTGARILQNLSIGNNCKIGAGAVVINDSGEGKTLVGVPAHEK